MTLARSRKPSEAAAALARLRHTYAREAVRTAAPTSRTAPALERRSVIPARPLVQCLSRPVATSRRARLPPVCRTRRTVSEAGIITCPDGSVDVLDPALQAARGRRRA